MKELTIIGGTGSLSTRVVHQLNAKGMRLKIVARNPEKAKKLLGDDVNIVQGDVSDIKSLNLALEGSSNVYIHLNTEVVDESQSFYTEREGVQNIVEAAEFNGVKHLIQIAGIESLRPDFFHAGILASEKIRAAGMESIKRSAIPHTILYCSFFLDSLLRYVSDGAIAIFGKAMNNIFFTNTDQLAEHLYHVTGNSEAFGMGVPVQGMEGLDIESGIRKFFSAYDPMIKIELLPLEAIDSFGLPKEEAAFLKHIWVITSGFQEEFISASAHEKFGKPTLTLEQYAAKLRSEQNEEEN